MTGRQRGLLLAGTQLLLALALFGRLAWDRATLPRVWARTTLVDPDDPFRGRYVRLWPVAQDRRADSLGRGRYAVSDGRLVVEDATEGGVPIRGALPDGSGVIGGTPIAFYIPEHAADPTHPPPGQQLWVELAVPPQGLPRPLRLELRPAAR